MPVRLLVLAAILAVGCRRSTPDAASAALRFLPASTEIAVRVDVARARTWSAWQKTADAAFRSMAAPIAAVKSACGLDVLGEATSFVFAWGPKGDITLVIAGLPKDKTTACPAKIGASIPEITITPDGTQFGIFVAGKDLASGAILPGGEVVIVSRGLHAVEAGAWRTEVASGSGAAPPWWGELDQAQPLALRVESKDRTITGSAELGDPLVVRAKVVSPTPELAATDQARAKAIVDFMTKAEAGTGRLEPKGTTLYADLTATGPQIDKLLAAGLSMLAPSEHTPAPPTGLDTSPIECSALTAAVATYMTTNLEAMPADQRAQTQPMFEKLVPALQKAYVESCTTGAWSPAAIHCHVDSATNLPRFEKCRLVLTAEQRTKFDEVVTTALSAP